MKKACRKLIRFLCLLGVTIVFLFSPLFDRVLYFFLDKDIPLIFFSPVESKVRGILDINLQVIDASEPIKINIYLNQQKLETAPRLLIDTTAFPDGNYLLEVEATDSSLRKNRAVSTATFAIDNTPPSVEVVLEKEILEPGGVIQGRINLKEKASLEAKINKDHLHLLERETPAKQGHKPDLYSYFFILAIPLTEESKFIEISLEATDEVGNKTAQLLTYKLKDKKFPTEYLTITEEKTPLLDVNLLRAERKIVEEVLEIMSKGIFWEGDFISPVDSVITSPFGYKRVYNQGLLIDQHKGIDYRAKEGTDIKATNSGFIVLSDFLKARGGTIIIDHGLGVMSLYYHLEEVRVKVGDRVSKGQVIGKAGDTGITTGPHLHFEIRIRKVAVNPLHFYGGK